MKTRGAFLSYAQQDAEWAREFSAELEQLGIKVWIDVADVRAGEPIARALEEGLRRCDSVILVLPSEQPRPNLLFEIGAALAMGKRVIPVVEAGIDPASIPFDLRMRKWIVRKSPAETANEVAGALNGASTAATSC